MASSTALRFSFHAARRSAPTFFVGHSSSSSKLAPTSLSSLRRRFLSYPAHELVGMPSLSPTMEAGTIATWKVKEGDSFIAGDSFCTVETDKATMDFEAQDEGVVAKILAPAGSQEIKCGEPILITVSSEADVAAFANYSVSASAPAAAAPVAPPPAPAAPAPVAPPPPAAAPQPVTPIATGGRVVASPLAFLLAKELGHDISAIVGTGPGGRIIAADVKEYVPAPASAVETSAAAAAPTTVAATPAAPAQAVFATAAPVVGAGYTDFPLSESAREIAARLTLSKQRVPHYYLTVDINMDKILELRSTLNAGIGKGPQLGVYELVLKAAAASMKTVPSVNASWMDSVVRVYDSVDINVVVGNGDALYTPVIRDCGSLGVKSISDALSKAVASLEGGSEEVTGSEFSAVGTFTVMNLGMYGIKSCAPIIREPQSCALALGAIENRIVPNDASGGDDDIYKQSTVMTATLSCDHRVVDGAVGAQWLSAFKAHIENPTTLLL